MRLGVGLAGVSGGEVFGVLHWVKSWKAAFFSGY